MTLAQHAKLLAQVHSEAQIQKDICRYLSMRGILHSVTDASRVWDGKGNVRKSKVRTGWPDISGVLPGGRALFIEVKKTMGRQSELQKVMLGLLQRQGALAFVARSASDVDKIFKEEGIIK